MTKISTNVSRLTHQEKSEENGGKENHGRPQEGNFVKKGDELNAEVHHAVAEEEIRDYGQNSE